MDPDKYQQAWQAHSSQARVTIHADLLLKEVQHSQRHFRDVIFPRDFVEVVIALLMLPLWFYMGITMALPWTWYLTVPAIIWGAGFILVDRMRHPQRPSEPGEPLLQCVKESLTQTERQIWLLRNVFWWYLLPYSISIMAFFAHVCWLASSVWWEFLCGLLIFGLVIFVIYAAVYFVNQRAVRVQLEPRRQDLLALLASLRDETTGENADDHVTLSALPFAEDRLTKQYSSPARLAIASIASLVIMVGVVVVITGGADSLVGAAVDSPREPEFDNVSAFSDTDISRIDAWLQEQVGVAQYPSLSVAIVREGKIVYQNAFGFENIKASKKATLQTQYHVASVTKAFTASLAVILHDRGVVDLDQPVVKYLPSDVSISTTPELGATITLRQLASHTSGLPRGVPGRVQSVEGWYDLEPKRLYDHLASATLEFDPGTDEEYSNLGFGLLGHALERAADEPFDRLLQEMVCDPLQLKRTAIQADDKLRPATGYSGSGWRFERKHSFRERLAPSGGLVTSVEDLAKFLAAQMKPGVFSSEMLKQLHTESILSNGSTARTALGWSVRSNVDVGRILKKNGGRSNCSAWIGFAPEHGVCAAVVTNCGGPDVDPIGYWLLERSVPQELVTKDGYAKVAPYTGVRWENDRPIVCVRDKWSPLVSIDDIPIDHIMEFARMEFGERARKRLAEDLVELLSTMGHKPKWEVTLGLETQDGQVEQLQVLMTKHNRNLVRD